MIVKLGKAFLPSFCYVRSVLWEGEITLEYLTFWDIIGPIVKTEGFQYLKTIKHHRTTRYLHSIHVAYLVYKISKRLNLDYVSATRGAILHDFFIATKDKYRGIYTAHPRLALLNAKQLFVVNAIEENIIISHMFPATLKLPSTKEAYLVNLTDNWCATLEFMTENPMYYLKEILSQESLANIPS